MKKKLISTILALTLIATSFAGCGRKAVEPDSSESAGASETSSDTESKEDEFVDLTGKMIESDYSPELPTETVSSDIFVEKIDGLSDDFIKGMDISSVLAEEESGVKYYNENGEEEDLFKILADAGVNYIRVRVWNDPFDSDGNGYGGGNCNAETAAEIGKRAAEYGMKLCVDFHYSDFWADPNKQMCPKAWENMKLSEKTDAIYSYTKESLETIIEAGANVGMVQIGNEINNGMAGETNQDNKITLLKSASKAVRFVGKEAASDIKVVVHFTEIDDYDGTMGIAEALDKAGLDYDIFGVSYYTFWHGTFENMQKVLTDIKSTYGVDTCVMETSYAFTAEDGDCSANSISEGDMLDNYPASVQGQANNLRDVMARASAAGSLGVFYWEGAWVPVGDNFKDNSKLWEQYGSGWASSFASEYDPKDAGQYYGGSSWDNQALFDFSGKALSSLNTFKWVNNGAVADKVEVLNVPDLEVSLTVGDDYTLPSEIDAVYNDSTCKDKIAVTWKADKAKAVDTNTVGKYFVPGTAADGSECQAIIKVSNSNYLENGSFEEADMSMWTVDYEGANPTDVQTKQSDAKSGENAFHFWSESSIEFSIEQEVKDLSAGKYGASASIQGGDVGSSAEIYLYVKVNDEIIQSDKVKLTGWVEWKTPTVKDVEIKDGDKVSVGMYVKAAAKGWGTIDDFEFYAMN